MDYVCLAPGLPHSSRLGFGCGSVMGRVGRAPSLRAIAAACDAGITHFDVARLYGYGEAEALLGEALRGRRDRVVIASKFGLVPTRAAVALRGLKPIVQKVVAGIPGLRPMIRSVVGIARAPDRFSGAAAEQSLHESLRALKTDYLDILLMHEGGSADFNDELAAFFEAQLAAGTIRAYGAASGIATIAELIRTHGGDILYQFANSVCVRNAENLPPATRQFVTHNPFFGADRLVSLLKTHPDRFRLPTGRVVEPADVHALMLGYALGIDSIGVVLCSMLGPEHLHTNVGVAERPAFSAEEIAAFVAAARTLGSGDLPG
jgi:aryl-alcohol dehydrogenase-like predicted oxidoreductase